MGDYASRERLTDQEHDGLVDRLYGGPMPAEQDKVPENGWWIFHENGLPSKQRVLIVNGHVASDEDWERAMGRAPNDNLCENYWEGNPVDKMTNGPLATGYWEPAEPQPAAREAELNIYHAPGKCPKHGCTLFERLPDLAGTYSCWSCCEEARAPAPNAPEPAAREGGGN